MNPLAFANALRRYWPYLAIAAFVALALYYRGAWQIALRERDAERHAHEITESNYRTAALEREKSDIINISRVKGERDANDKETVDDYEARIDQLRADFSERVRREAKADTSGTAAANLPQLPDGAGSPDARACQTELLETELAASELAEQVVGLQSWIKKTAAINTNGSL